MHTLKQLAEFMKIVPVRSRTLLRYTIKHLYRYYAIYGFESLMYDSAYYKYHYQALDYGKKYYTVYVADPTTTHEDYYINEYNGTRHVYARELLRYEAAKQRKRKK